MGERRRVSCGLVEPTRGEGRQSALGAFAPQVAVPYLVCARADLYLLTYLRSLLPLYHSTAVYTMHIKYSAAESRAVMCLYNRKRSQRAGRRVVPSEYRDRTHGGLWTDVCAGHRHQTKAPGRTPSTDTPLAPAPCHPSPLPKWLHACRRPATCTCCSRRSS